MKKFHKFQLTLAAAAAVVGLSTTALAADPDAEAARQQRMDAALQSYHDSRNPSPGPAARAEESMKRGAHRAGSAIKHGAEKTGEAIGTGVRKTGDALHRAGRKVEDKSTGSGTTNNNPQ